MPLYPVRPAGTDLPVEWKVLTVEEVQNHGTKENEAKGYFEHEGKLWEQDYEHKYSENKHYGEHRGWPIHSTALQIDRDQIQEFTEGMKKRGVPTDYDHKGRPIFRNPGHKKAYCKVFGIVDKDSYGGMY